MTKTGIVSLEEVVELFNAQLKEIKELKKENEKLKQELTEQEQHINKIKNILDMEINSTEKQISSYVESAKDKNTSRDKVRYIIDILFHLRGYLKALTYLKDEIE